MRRILTVLLCLGLASTSLLADTAAERLGESATVLQEVLAAPDKGIPEDLLRKAHCVVVVPGVKQGAFIVGAKYGRGFLVAAPLTAAGAPPARCASKAAASGSRSAVRRPTSSCS